jgi:multimeric flavodoxin WrbA
MKILVLNGSPKGDLSVTLQYVNYLAKMMPEVEFKPLHIAQRIKAIENTKNEFEEILAEVRSADGVLWSFPLYFLLVHGHYKRFIELIFERGGQEAFSGKYAAAISTSIHYFDHTAHRYIQSICDDLGMRFVESLSAEMNDLFQEKERRNLERFGRHFIHAMETRAATRRQYPPVSWQPWNFQAEFTGTPVDTGDKKVAIIYDGEENAGSLENMVRYCTDVYGGKARLVNLREVEIKSGCLGCLKCGLANECTFEGKDGYIEFFRSEVSSADILIFAGRIHDRYLSARWKIFFDRSFFNTHTPSLIGKQLAFVISGPFGQIPNLSEIFQAYSEFQGANLVGFATDEAGESEDVARGLAGLMTQAAEWARESYARPQTFLGVGGMKIFRDDVYGRLRPVFQADHRAFARLGLYRTFPQVDWRTQIMNFFAVPILNIPVIKKGFQSQIKEGLVAPYKKLVEKS